MIWPWTTSKRLSALEAQVAELERAVEPQELERLRGSVLNALRALRRVQQAQEEREAKGKPEIDDIDRMIALRRRGKVGG